MRRNGEKPQGTRHEAHGFTRRKREAGEFALRNLRLIALPGFGGQFHARQRPEFQHAPDGCGNPLALPAGNREFMRADIGRHLLRLGGEHRQRDIRARHGEPAIRHLALDAVGRTEEAEHEFARGMAVDLLGRTQLLHHALVHQHHAIGEFERLFLVMRHEDRGDVQVVMELAQPAAEFLAHLGIERTEGLVEQQHLRLHGQRAGQRDALPLPAGELRRRAIREPGELHEIEQFHHLPADFRLGGALRTRANPQAESHVLEHAHMAEQRVMLEHEAHLPLAHMAVAGIAPSKRMRPRSAVSSPAMMRSSVVFPQPEGRAGPPARPWGNRASHPSGR